MFKVVLNDGQNEMPEDDIFYIIAKEGVYLKKKLGVMESLAPVKNISILESVTSMAKMHINPIPGKWIAKVMGFFKAVYEEHRSEAIVLLFYDAETGKHKIIPPVQKVAGASCDYDKGITIEGMAMIGTIHSHGSMSAFHSGVDDHDEEHFDGLHITLGDLDEDYPSISSSIVANGFRVMVEPDEYIDDLILMSEINQVDGKAVRTVYKVEDGKLVEDKAAVAKYSYQWKKYDRHYGVNVSARDKIFNKKWLKMVEKGTYTYKSYRGQVWGGYGYAGYGLGRGAPRTWGQHYDPYAWADAGRLLPPGAKTGTKAPPQNVGVTVEPLKFPPHTPEGDFVPCVTCVHRMCKLSSEIEDDDFTDDIYQCTQCGEIVRDTEADIDDVVCLGCMTADHLVLVDDKNLLHSYTPSDEFDYMFERDQQGVVDNSNYVTCKECGNGFHMFEADALCPFCHTPVDENSSEAALVSQAMKDSGGLLTPEQAEVNDAALKAAREADETIERIPEPGSSTIPISRKKDGMLKSMFQKVFQKERDDD